MARHDLLRKVPEAVLAHVVRPGYAAAAQALALAAARELARRGYDSRELARRHDPEQIHTDRVTARLMDELRAALQAPRVE